MEIDWKKRREYIETEMLKRGESVQTFIKRCLIRIDDGRSEDPQMVLTCITVGLDFSEGMENKEDEYSDFIHYYYK